MHVPSGLVLALAGACAVAQVPAQVFPGVFGHQVIGQNGTAGEFCRVFDCTPRPLVVTRGETLTLTVNAPFQAPFAIGVAAAANGCVRLPQFDNALILDAPFALLSLGLVTPQSPILSCWDGHHTEPLVVPATLPPGFQFATQAAALVPTLSGNPAAFSVAVRCTVQ